MCNHIGTHEDIKVQIIGHCDPNDQEAREDFWIFHLDTFASTLHRLGGAGKGGRRWSIPLYGFSKNVSSKERVKPLLFVTFDIVL